MKSMSKVTFGAPRSLSQRRAAPVADLDEAALRGRSRCRRLAPELSRRSRRLNALSAEKTAVPSVRVTPSPRGVAIAGGQPLVSISAATRIGNIGTGSLPLELRTAAMSPIPETPFFSATRDDSLARTWEGGGFQRHLDNGTITRRRPWASAPQSLAMVSVSNSAKIAVPVRVVAAVVPRRPVRHIVQPNLLSLS